MMHLELEDYFQKTLEFCPHESWEELLIYGHRHMTAPKDVFRKEDLGFGPNWDANLWIWPYESMTSLKGLLWRKGTKKKILFRKLWVLKNLGSTTYFHIFLWKYKIKPFLFRPNFKLYPLSLVKVQFSPLSFDRFNSVF